jgi:hypothetical protein
VFLEEHPWLLIVAVIGIVEAWGLTKAVGANGWRGSGSTARRPDGRDEPRAED